MSKFEELSLIVSSVSIIVAAGSLFYTFYKTFRLGQGQTELVLRANISQARSQVEDVKLQLKNSQLQFESQKELLSADGIETQKRALEFTEQLLKTRIENLLNQYETACSTYRDQKIDTKRFKLDYRNEIREIVEGSIFKEYFDPIRTIYPEILKTYIQWENKPIKINR